MRKAKFTEEEVRALHAEMVPTGLTYSEFAKTKELKPSLLYSNFNKYKLEFTKLKRGRPSVKKEVAV